VTLASLDMPAAATPAMEAPVRMAAPRARQLAPAAAQAGPSGRPRAGAGAEPLPRFARPAPRAADPALLRRASVEAPAATPEAGQARRRDPPAARPVRLWSAQRTIQAIDRGARPERGAERTPGRPR
jgi:hypothetical protein